MKKSIVKTFAHKTHKNQFAPETHASGAIQVNKVDYL